MDCILRQLRLFLLVSYVISHGQDKDEDEDKDKEAAATTITKMAQIVVTVARKYIVHEEECTLTRYIHTP